MLVRIIWSELPLGHEKGGSEAARPVRTLGAVDQARPAEVALGVERSHTVNQLRELIVLARVVHVERPNVYCFR